jgi:hypothetical protein
LQQHRWFRSLCLQAKKKAAAVKANPIGDTANEANEGIQMYGQDTDEEVNK